MDVSSDAWLRLLNQIIRGSIIETLPKVDDILYEEILKAFNCDLSMLVPVDGDGLNGPIIINISAVDQLKQLLMTLVVQLVNICMNRTFLIQVCIHLVNLHTQLIDF